MHHCCMTTPRQIRSRDPSILLALMLLGLHRPFTHESQPQGTVLELASLQFHHLQVQSQQGFRRFTVKKLEILHKKHINFMIKRGQHGKFMKAWVFISHSKAVFNVEAMDANLNLTFSLTGDDARLHDPREDGLLSLGLFKQMSSDFVVLGCKVGGRPL